MQSVVRESSQCFVPHSRYLNLTACRENGSATMTEPVGGFANAALFTMFNPPPPTHTSPPTSPPPIPPHPRAKSNAYIAGIVIGTVAGIAIVVGLSACIVYQRRRTQRPFEMQGESAQEKGTKSRCEHLPVEMPPREMPLVELAENQRPAELP
jgi:hypothetical protein